MTLFFLIREEFRVGNPLIIEVFGFVTLGALTFGGDVTIDEFLDPAVLLVELELFALDQAFEDVGVEVVVVTLDLGSDSVGTLHWGVGAALNEVGVGQEAGLIGLADGWVFGLFWSMDGVVLRKGRGTGGLGGQLSRGIGAVEGAAEFV